MQARDENTLTHEQEFRLRGACLDFVAMKDGLDAIGKHQPFASPLERAARRLACLSLNSGEEWTAIHPQAFCRYALPFSDPDGGRETSMAPATINPRLVISGSRNFSPASWARDIDPTEVMDWSDGLVDANDGNDTGQMPRVTQIGNLPLFVAVEGKNRVALFKRYRLTMRAMVMKTAFPQPHELQMIRLRPFGVYALKHAGVTQVLPFPAYTVPLLEAYGVPKGEAVMDATAVLQLCRKRQYLCSQQMMP